MLASLILLYCCCFDVPWKFQNVSYVYEIFWQFILLYSLKMGKSWEMFNDIERKLFRYKFK